MPVNLQSTFLPETFETVDFKPVLRVAGLATGWKLLYEDGKYTLSLTRETEYPEQLTLMSRPSAIYNITAFSENHKSISRIFAKNIQRIAAESVPELAQPMWASFMVNDPSTYFKLINHDFGDAYGQAFLSSPPEYSLELEEAIQKLLEQGESIRIPHMDKIIALEDNTIVVRDIADSLMTQPMRFEAETFIQRLLEETLFCNGYKITQPFPSIEALNLLISEFDSGTEKIFFIKPASLGSQGERVYRCVVTDTNMFIFGDREGNIESLGLSLFKEKIEGVYHCVYGLYPFNLENDNPDLVRVDLHYDEPEVAGRILDAVIRAQFDHFIIESELPIVRILDNKKPECRVICQFNPDTKKLEVTASYVKLGKEHLSNISTGGIELSTDDYLAEINKLYPHNTITKYSLYNAAMKFCASYAIELYRRLSDLPGDLRTYYAYRPVKNIAIDLAIIQKDGKLEIGFIEAQAEFGYSGLELLDESAAMRVADLIILNE